MQFEKVVFRGINKDISPKVVDSNGNRRVLNPLIEAENCRYSIGENGTFEAVQNLKSTQKLFDFVEQGENQVIGTYFDKWNNVFLYFVWNSNGRHGIYGVIQQSSGDPLQINIVTDPSCLTRGITSTPLFFEKNNYIHSVVVVEKILFWQYKGVVRKVKMFADNNTEGNIMLNNPKTVSETSLLVPSPTVNLSPIRTQIVGSFENKIVKNTYQFATRYVMFDNTVTTLSAYSYFSFRDQLISGSFGNAIRITFNAEASLRRSIKKVQILFRRDDSDDWKIAIDSEVTSFTFDFTDTLAYEIVPANETAKPFDSVPNKVSTIAALKNRVFITSDEEGFEDRGNVSAVFTTSRTTSFVPNTSIDQGRLWFKDGGNYGVGIVFFDEQMRTDGVVNKTSINFNYVNTIGNQSVFNPPTARAFVNITGTPPSWAHYFSVVRTANRKQSVYMQIPVKPMFYLGEFKDGVSIPADYHRFSNGKVYSGNYVSKDNYNYIHLQLPDNLPYVPNVGDTVRILNAWANGAEAKILDYDGQVIVCGNFGIDNWAINGSTVAYYLLVEIYNEDENQNEVYFECSKLQRLYNDTGTYLGFTPNIELIGDTYRFDGDNTTGPASFTNLRHDSNEGVLNTYNPTQKTTLYTVESMSPLATEDANTIVTPKKPTKRETTQNLIERVKSRVDNDPSTNLSLLTKKFRLESYTRRGTSKLQASDYTKANGQVGRPFVPKKSGVAFRNNVIRYSDPYLEDSNINGLSKFDALNEYALSGDRTPIRKLQAVGNILLAIHEQNITSLYVGEGFIREADGNETLIKTRDVIGQDRLLAGGFGTKHPESISANENMCFGYDVVKGAIWRYTNAGVISISDFGMMDYFLTLSRKIQSNHELVKVVSAIDEYHKEFIISFRKTENFIDIENQTWVFNYEQNYWSCRARFIPDNISFNGNMLLGYNEAGVWVHNSKNVNTYNNFYGQQYNRVLKLFMNFAPFKSKVALSLQIAQENLADDGDENVVVEVKALSDFDRLNTVEQQRTEMRLGDFELIEGVYYGPILKDINSVVLDGEIPILHGDDLRDQIFEVTINNRTNKPAKLYYVNFGYIFSEYSN